MFIVYVEKDLRDTAASTIHVAGANVEVAQSVSATQAPLVCVVSELKGAC